MSKGNYAATITLSPRVIEDIQWWKDQEILYPRKIDHTSPALSLTTDASNKGWGAHTKGQSSGGEWSTSENKLHINEKELLAVLKGLHALFSRVSHTKIFI